MRMKTLPVIKLFLKESQSVLMLQCLYKSVLKTSVMKERDKIDFTSIYIIIILKL